MHGHLRANKKKTREVRFRRLTAAAASIVIVAVAAVSVIWATSVTSASSESTASSRTAMPGFRLYEHVLGGWSIEYPEDWRVRDFRRQGAAFTSYDPLTASFEVGLRFDSGVANPPISELRMHVEVWPNEPRWSSKEYADAFLDAPPTRSHARTVSRSGALVGQLAAETAVVVEESPNGPRAVVYWFVASPAADRVVVIRAWPAESIRRAQLGLAIASLTIK